MPAGRTESARGAARIIFQDFESSNWSWDPVANAYFWHRFYAHQPDLNYESADVRRQMLRMLDYWFRHRASDRRSPRPGHGDGTRLGAGGNHVPSDGDAPGCVKHPSMVLDRAGVAA